MLRVNIFQVEINDQYYYKFKYFNYFYFQYFRTFMESV